MMFIGVIQKSACCNIKLAIFFKRFTFNINYVQCSMCVVSILRIARSTSRVRAVHCVVLCLVGVALTETMICEASY